MIGVCRTHRNQSALRKQYMKLYAKVHKEGLTGYKKQYYEKNKEHLNTLFYARVKNDLNTRLVHNLRARLRRVLKQKKTFSFSKSIGCSIDFLKKHLESKFQPGMSWENYGKWGIDHIFPLSKADSQEHMKKLNHYTNLQPLWNADNIRKSNRI